MSTPGKKHETEETPAGAQQMISGVAPISLRARLVFKAMAPLEANAAQKCCDHGLFDFVSRRQSDLIDELRRMSHADESDPQSPKKEKD